MHNFSVSWIMIFTILVFLGVFPDKNRDFETKVLARILLVIMLCTSFALHSLQ